MKLSTLAAIVQGQLLGTDVNYTTISIDSRTLEPGELFVAIQGDRWDGHLFIEQAKARGAVGALVEKFIASDLPLLQVSSTRKALGQIAKQHRSQFSFPVIALTGSCGKTTTKEMLRIILEGSGQVLATVKNFNNDIGVPLTLLNLTAQHQFAVIEMGTNHPGEIAYLSNIAQPDIALITNIAPAHLQGLGSIEGVARAKSEIFSGLSSKGIAIINADDHFARGWQSLLTPYRVIRFGLSDKADFSAQNIQLDSAGKARFTLVTPSNKLPIYLALPGQHQVMNALAAAAAASQVGITLDNIKAGLEKTQSIPGRSMVTKTKTGVCIIDDTYNANPASVAAALKLLAHYSGRHIFVMGDMAELGDDAAHYHRQVGQLARELRIDEVYTCGHLAVLTAKAFGLDANHFSHQKELILALKPRLKAGVTVLVKGSFSSHMEKVVAALVKDE